MPCPGANEGSIAYSPMVMVPPTRSAVQRSDWSGVLPPAAEVVSVSPLPPQAVSARVAVARIVSARVARNIRSPVGGCQSPAGRPDVRGVSQLADGLARRGPGRFAVVRRVARGPGQA